MAGQDESSHFMDVYEALDVGLHSADDILLNLFLQRRNQVRWDFYKGETKTQRGPQVT